MPKVEVLVIALSSPIQVGIYEDGNLIKTLTSSEKTSDVLPLLIDEVQQDYRISKLYYVQGPGNYMAIKIAYIFLRTFCIASGCLLEAADGFAFNDNTPIKSIGNKYFIKEGNVIITKTLNDDEKASIKALYLPKALKEVSFSAHNEPLYVLPAV